MPGRPQTGAEWLNESREWPTLASQVPFKLKGASVTELVIICAKCNRQLPPEQTRAKLLEFPKGVMTCVTVTPCFDCNVVIPKTFIVRYTPECFQIEDRQENKVLVWRRHLSIVRRLWNRICGLVRPTGSAK